jgi:hypothetical protein
MTGGQKCFHNIVAGVCLQTGAGLLNADEHARRGIFVGIHGGMWNAHTRAAEEAALARA